MPGRAVDAYSPVVSGGRALARTATTDGRAKMVSAHDPHTGRLLWSVT